MGGKWEGSGREVGGKWEGSGREVGGKWEGSGREVGGKWEGSRGSKEFTLRAKNSAAKSCQLLHTHDILHLTLKSSGQ